MTNNSEPSNMDAVRDVRFFDDQSVYLVLCGRQKIETTKKCARFGNFYFTASFKALAALNLGTLIAGTEIVSPVRGFLACLAALVFVENIPRPAIETSPPFFSVPTTGSKKCTVNGRRLCS